MARRCWSPAERAELDAAIAHLLTMRSTGTTNQIKEAIEAADAASGDCSRRMDASIRKVLTGQNVNKV
jgi:molecular chaperone HscA